jgi:TonB family protein
MIAAFANLLAAAAIPAQAPAPARWVVDWGDQRCSLVRETGGPDSRTLMVRTVPGAGKAELWLFDPKWAGPTSLRFKNVDVGLEPSGFQVSEPAVSVRFRGQDGLAVTNLDESFIKNLAGAGSVRIDHAGRRLAEVPVPTSARAVASLNQCEDAVMRDWGFDPEVMRSLSRPAAAVGGAAKWLSDADYPLAALRAGQRGSVLTRLVVGVDGRAAQCEVVEGSGFPVLDKRTCDILMDRVPYQAALDAAGQPVRGMTSIRIVWRLP